MSINFCKIQLNKNNSIYDYYHNCKKYKFLHSSSFTYFFLIIGFFHDHLMAFFLLMHSLKKKKKLFIKKKPNITKLFCFIANESLYVFNYVLGRISRRSNSHFNNKECKLKKYIY